MRRRTHQSGVTLMELLVAITLLGLLSVGILFALRIGLNAMGHSNDRLMMNRRVIGVQKIFQQQVAGYMPAKIDCHLGPEGPPTTIPFFEGNPQTMRFVSSYSLQEGNRGIPHILEFHVIPGENGRGVRLIVNELLYTGPAGAGLLCQGTEPDPLSSFPVPLMRRVETGSFSFVLADKLATCHFLYRETPQPPEPERWVEHWGHARMPAAVRVVVAPLDPDPARLQLVSMTEPIRVNRDIMTRYNE